MKTAEPEAPKERGPVVSLSRRTILVTVAVLVMLIVVGFLVGYALAPAPYSATHPASSTHPAASGGASQHPATPAPGPVGQPLHVAGNVDTFSEPPDQFSLGTFASGQPWMPVAGVWGTTGASAYVSAPGPGRNLALIKLATPDAAIQVSMDHLVQGAGLVFRYRDASDYWYVAAVPAYASWSITKVIAGRQTTVANTGLSPVTDGTTLAVRTRGSRIEVALNGVVRRVVSDPELSSATFAGLGVAGSYSGAARFGDFRVAGAAPPGQAPAATP